MPVVKKMAREREWGCTEIVRARAVWGGTIGHLDVKRCTVNAEKCGTRIFGLVERRARQTQRRAREFGARARFLPS